MTSVDLSGAANIPSHSRLDWFSSLPCGTFEVEGLRFELGGPIVLTHGYVEDGRARFMPNLPEEVTLPVGRETPFIAFLHVGLFQYNAIREGATGGRAGVLAAEPVDPEGRE